MLDRSGSMDGERMRAVQAAVTGALDTLADRDVVSVVLFGSEVETLVEAQRCDQARERFARLGPIEAAGGAALYDGLSQGAAQVRRFAGPATVDQLILVTDGAATKGPRERADVLGLVETFVRDGTAVSAIGLGDEFDEDLLAAVARVGGGRFVFAASADRLADAVLGEVAPSRAVVAIDAVLTLEFRANCDEIRAHGARAAAVETNTVTIHFAQLTAGQELSALASGTLDSFAASGIQRDLVRVRLRWTDPASGETRELVQGVTARFSPESRDLLDGYNIRVYRAAVASMISEGMQAAIEQLDRGDFRRALRELRRARSRARDVNYAPDDAEIAAMIGQLDAYIAEVEARGMNVLDRKILRSGLYNQFETPSAGEGGPAK
ncbi:MAG: VWA domain-containing protein [Opitutaceae bacterium]|nr:VWA domain-containing protein [Opitutaceae bacterium]